MKSLIVALTSLLLVASSSYACTCDGIKTPSIADQLIDSYLVIQKGLASDGLVTAKKGAEQFILAVENTSENLEREWKLSKLGTSARVISATSKIETARIAFLELSQGMISLLEEMGATLETPLYIAYCPMAFDNKGGSWLQSDKTLANPYYGPMMLRCGRIQKQITKSHSNHTDSFHDHDRKIDNDGEHEGHG